MERLFGVQLTTLATVLAASLIGAIVVVGLLALRNRIFFKLGVRNLTRRRGRSAVIVLGLMLATAIIASALSTGDTMSSTIRSTVFRTLGNTDEVVGVHRSDTGGAMYAEAVQATYFPATSFPAVAESATSTNLVDGVAPAIVDSIAVQDQTSRQNEPRVGLFATDAERMAGFGTIESSNGAPVSLDALGATEVYVNDRAVDKFHARPGDQLLVLYRDRLTPFTVKDVVRYDGTGTDGAALLMPLATAQALTGHPNEINHILLSNNGDAASGVTLTNQVTAALNPTLDPMGFEASATKQEGLDNADAQGNAFMSLFTTFGTFTIAAGILLIFLIFVLLAAERRGEMGIARAIGTQRGHLVQMFLFEGVAYDLLAALVGAGLGVAIAFAMVQAIASAISSEVIDVEFSVQPASILVAYCLGVLLTLLIVTASAWRVSVLNVSQAIRNLPDPSHHRRRRSWLLGMVGIAFGALMTSSGISAGQATPFLVGVSLVIVSLVPIAVALRVPDRVAYTTGGAALVVWLLLPFSAYKALVPGLSMDFSAWVANGLLVVIGATWLIVYNSDVVLGVVMRVFGRVKSLAPVLKTSVTTPLRNRFRTGMTLAMFTLVVFTLVVGVVTTSSFTDATNDLAQFSGGFQVRAETSPASPITDVRGALQHVDGVAADSVTAVGQQSFVPAEVTQTGTGAAYADYPVRGLNEAYLTLTTYGMATKARGYATDRDVWNAVRSTPGYAVVDAMVVPHRDNWGFGVMPDFQITGFYAEDQAFDPVTLDVRDPQTGAVQQVTVIGVLKDTVPMLMSGISVSQQTLASFGARATPTVYYFALQSGVDADEAATNLEAAFLGNGMQAQSMASILDELIGASVTMQRISLGFMGLGLVVGVAALAVISARAVVERRQQIGVLRAIGFQRKMVQRSFLLESSFITLVSIVVGTVLGLVVARNVIVDASAQGSWANIELVVPWTNLVGIFAAVYLAGLLTTWAPARRAARVYPAEALRYQ